MTTRSNNAGRQRRRDSGYRSKLEERVAAELTEKGIPFLYEPEKLEYHKKVRSGVCRGCSGKEVYQRHTYLPDFKIGKRYIEVKGRFTSSDRTKMLAVREGNPKVMIFLVFSANNKLHKSSPTRYGDWADKHGFIWALAGAIPKRWYR